MKFFIVLSALIITALSGCTKESIKGSGSEVTVVRSAGNFTKVESHGSTLVFITRDPDFSVKVKGYENLIPYFESTNTNGTLLLRFKNGVNITNNNIQVIITMPVVEGLNLSGSGVIMASGIFPLPTI